MCELTVNGQDAGAAFWSPCSFELAGLARPGANPPAADRHRQSGQPLWGSVRCPMALGVKETFWTRLLGSAAALWYTGAENNTQNG